MFSEKTHPKSYFKKYYYLMINQYILIIHMILSLELLIIILIQFLQKFSILLSNISIKKLIRLLIQILYLAQIMNKKIKFLMIWNQKTIAVFLINTNMQVQNLKASSVLKIKNLYKWYLIYVKMILALRNKIHNNNKLFKKLISFYIFNRLSLILITTKIPKLIIKIEFIHNYLNLCLKISIFKSKIL